MESSSHRLELLCPDEYESTNPDLQRSRRNNDLRLKGLWENIFEKYGKDFEGQDDTIDLVTGEIVVDNGHLSGVQKNTSTRMLRAFTEDVEVELSDDQDELAAIVSSPSTAKRRKLTDANQNEHQRNHDAEAKADKGPEITDARISATIQASTTNLPVMNSSAGETSNNTIALQQLPVTPAQPDPATFEALGKFVWSQFSNFMTGFGAAPPTVDPKWAAPPLPVHTPSFQQQIPKPTGITLAPVRDPADTEDIWTLPHSYKDNSQSLRKQKSNQTAQATKGREKATPPKDSLGDDLDYESVSDIVDDDPQMHFERRLYPANSSAKLGGNAGRKRKYPFAREDEQLLLHMKITERAGWDTINKQWPHIPRCTLKQYYYKKLKHSRDTTETEDELHRGSNPPSGGRKRNAIRTPLTEPAHKESRPLVDNSSTTEKYASSPIRSHHLTTSSTIGGQGHEQRSSMKKLIARARGEALFRDEDEAALLFPNVRNLEPEPKEEAIIREEYDMLEQDETSQEDDMVMPLNEIDPIDTLPSTIPNSTSMSASPTPDVVDTVEIATIPHSSPRRPQPPPTPQESQSDQETPQEPPVSPSESVHIKEEEPTTPPLTILALCRSTPQEPKSKDRDDLSKRRRARLAKSSWHHLHHAGKHSATPPRSAIPRKLFSSSGKKNGGSRISEVLRANEDDELDELAL